jgi:hypothetical protein
MGNYVPSLCGGGPHWSFWMCKPERCLIFCVCVVIVLILFFVFVMLWAFTCVYFCFSFTCFHHVYLCSPPLSGFFARLWALLDLFTTSSCAAFTRSLIFCRLCAAFMRAFVSRSRTRYSVNGCPWDYACVRWGYLLWDSALVLLTFFFYRIGKTLREMIILFTWSCLSP